MEIKRKIASIRTSTHVSSASQRASFGTNQNILEIQLYAMINVWHFCNGNVLCRRGKKTSPKRQRSNFRLVGAFIPKFITWVIMQFNIIERFWLVFLLCTIWFCGLVQSMIKSVNAACALFFWVSGLFRRKIARIFQQRPVPYEFYCFRITNQSFRTVIGAEKCVLRVRMILARKFNNHGRWHLWGEFVLIAQVLHHLHAFISSR